MPMKRPGRMAISAMNRNAGEAARACTPTKRALRNSDRSSIGCEARISVTMKAMPSSAEASSEPATAASRQPFSGASSMP